MSYLRPEDYLEPSCPLCQPDGEQTPIDVCRMLGKLDEDFSRNDYAAAERHLNFWLAEADYHNDRRGRLAVLNEKMGLHRKLGQEAPAIDAAEQALALVDELKLQNSVTAGTTWLNAATVYKAFGRAKDALPLYARAEEVYRAFLPEGDPRFGGLYNNYALALADEDRYREAEEDFRRALAVMERAEHGEAEQAVTWLNLADLAERELGVLDADALTAEYLDRAEALLNTPDLPRSPDYAFYCEKCAPTFRYFGRFACADELERRAREIYERA